MSRVAPASAGTATTGRAAALLAGMHRVCCSCVLAILTPVLARAQMPEDLRHLTDELEAAHRTADAKPVTAFRADLRLMELARDAATRGELELTVAFLEWQKPETGRPYPLIRYRQTDSARVVEQGRDRKDYWSFADGKEQDMLSREMETDLANCRRNVKIARQMILFVDPANVLRTLVAPEPVRQEDLVLGRTAKIACDTVAGRIDTFPLRQQAGDDVAVAAKAFVERASHRLVALEVRALEQGKPAATGEFLLFSDHRQANGRLVPMRIVHFALDADGRRHVQMSIDITRLDLAPELAPADFDRPR